MRAGTYGTTSGFGRRLRRAVLATSAAAACLLAGAAVAWGEAAPTIYVSNHGENTVTPVNAVSGVPGTPIKVGSGPWGVSITPDGSTVFVANSGSASVTPIDTATGTAGTPIPVGEGPREIAITPDGKMAYVTNWTSGTVTPFEVATGAPGTPIPVGKEPMGIAITPNGETAYVANYGSNTITPIDLSTNTAGSEIPVGEGPKSIAITPDGGTAYVVNYNAGTVTPVTVETNTTGTPIAVGTNPAKVAITPEGGTAYVANYGGETITPIEIATNTPRAPIVVGSHPLTIAVNPDGANAYVAVSEAKALADVALATETVEAPISVGSEPYGVAVTPDQAPVASFTASAGTAGSPTGFDAGESRAESAEITSYRWRFGDGTGAESATPTISHTYASAGIYMVTLTETDADGTSTTQVFTGQTVLRNGDSSAQASRALTIAAAAPGFTGPSVSVPSVTLQPTSRTVTSPGFASFTVACAGTPEPVIQWLYSSDKGDAWSEMRSQTAPVLAFGDTVPSLSGSEYRARCSNIAGSALSDVVTLTVKARGPHGGDTVRLAQRVGLSGAPLRVGPRGNAAMTMTCPRSTRSGCKGTVSLTLNLPHPRRTRAQAAICTRGCRALGSEHYQARAGQKISVRVHIASFGRRLLAQRRVLHVSVVASNVSGGKLVCTVATLMLKA